MEVRLRERFKAAGADLRIVRSFDGRLLGQTWETPFIGVPSGTIVEYPRVPRRRGGKLEPTRRIELRHLSDTPIAALEYDRAKLCAGDEIAGPAIIREPLSTTYMPPGQVLTVGEYGEPHIRCKLLRRNDHGNPPCRSRRPAA